MSEIVLTTLNARYHHTAFGLRYLFANLQELQSRATLLEFTIQQATLDIVETILRESPRVVGFGVYIWNVVEIERVLIALKSLRPDLMIVLGGPELGDPHDLPSLTQWADYLIAGEADLAFADLCQKLLAEDVELSSERPRIEPLATTQLSHVPDLASVELPYDLYSDTDLQHRVIYVEASRGCPFTCEFCLSALEIPVRQFPLETFLGAMQRLLDRGCREFKFVDRTFNLNLRVSRAILEFFLARYVPGLFLHFEMIPDHLPEALKALITQFPAGSLQFEVGIQTWNDDVAVLISRRQDNVAAEQNLKWLREETGVHVHADLIVGLPGEDFESFAAGFDRLVRLEPQEIQVGILKRLRGTPITRHDAEWQMVFATSPPYEILQNRLIDFATIQELRRFAKTWDLIANSGNFLETTRAFWAKESSPFAAVHQFSRWLYEQAGRTHGIALPRLLEFVWRYLTDVQGQPQAEIAAMLFRDYRRGGRSDHPACLRPWLSTTSSEGSDTSVETAQEKSARSGQGPKRQQRFLQTDAP
ncbi:DUF4080 domain-containing protein [bacterium]|nr:DUF4080 domain-containing protein [bacterium]